jgi:hypothetical protein
MIYVSKSIYYENILYNYSNDTYLVCITKYVYDDICVHRSPINKIVASLEEVAYRPQTRQGRSSSRSRAQQCSLKHALNLATHS